MLLVLGLIACREPLPCLGDGPDAFRPWPTASTGRPLETGTPAVDGTGDSGAEPWGFAAFAEYRSVDGSGSFGSTFQTAAFWDADVDGTVEIAFATGEEATYLFALPSDAGARFTTDDADIRLEQVFGSLSHVADLDADGDQDLVLELETLAGRLTHVVFAPVVDGERRQLLSSRSSGFGVSCVADFDGDGFLDLLGSGPRYLGIHWGPIAPGPMLSVEDDLVSTLRSVGEPVDCGDVNGDGIADIVATGLGPPSPVAVMFGPFPRGTDPEAPPNWQQHPIPLNAVSTRPVLIRDASGTPVSLVLMTSLERSDWAELFWLDLPLDTADPKVLAYLPIDSWGPHIHLFGAGDVDGDGLTDVGVYLSTFDQVGAYVYPGGASDRLTWLDDALRVYEPDGQSYTPTHAADVNRDGFADWVGFDWTFPGDPNVGQLHLGGPAGWVPLDSGFSR